MRRVSKGLWLVQFLVLALAGCESPGFSARDTELARQQGKVGFAVLEASPARAVFAVKGREVVVEPPEGYCLDEQSLAVTRRSAFALVADCIESEEKALADGGGSGDLSEAFPGILTVTVSGETAFGGEPGALAAFETLLDTTAGGRLLGRGDGAGTGRVVTARRVDGALYVLVEETGAEGAQSIFAPRFWRVFTEINDRLVLVTLSGFKDRPVGEDEMLAFLAAQMTALRSANDMTASVDEAQTAARVLAGLESAPSVAEGRSAQAPLLAPMAPRRPG